MRTSVPIVRLRDLAGGVVDGIAPARRRRPRARAAPTVFAALDDAGIAVASVTVARPFLDGVYLRHAGRRFEGNCS
jgi:ABC-2 type transport system ATP-binding protein